MPRLIFTFAAALSIAAALACDALESTSCCAGGGPSDCAPNARHREVVERAKACSDGEECVVAHGDGTCLCPIAVRASMQAEVDASAAEFECCGAMADCPFVGTPRCVQGRCEADD